MGLEGDRNEVITGTRLLFSLPGLAPAPWRYPCQFPGLSRSSSPASWAGLCLLLTILGEAPPTTEKPGGGAGGEEPEACFLTYNLVLLHMHCVYPTLL